MIPLVCAYCPVRKLARDGEQSGVVIKALRNSAPSLPMRSMLGVLMYGCPAMPSSSQRRSSIRMKTMLGRALLAAPEGRWLIPDNGKVK